MVSARALLVAFAVFAGLPVPAAAQAAPPANDQFAAAQELTGTTPSTTGTVAEATKQAGEPRHAGYTGGRSIWFTWTAPGTGVATIDTFGSRFDSLLGVYTGTAVEALTKIAGNDDAGGTVQSHVRIAVTAGTTYRIAVDVYSLSTTTNDVKLSIRSGPPPVNDAFAAAPALTGPSATAAGTTIGASREYGEPFHARSTLATVWWTWTAPTDGGVVIDTADSAIDTTLAVYTGNAVDELSQVAANADAGSARTSRVAFRARAGTVYRIAVSTDAAGTDGDVALRILTRPTPENDAFAAAVDLGGDDAALSTGRTDGASTEVGEPSHYGFDAPRSSVWYRWTAPADGSVTIRADAGFSAAIGVYTGTAVNALSRVTLQAQDHAGGPEQVRVRVSAGMTYLIAVDAFRLGEGGDFALSLARIDRPANDDFADAETLAGLSDDAEGTNLGATQEPGEPIHDDNYYDPSAWFTWTAPQDTGVTLDTADSTFDTVVAVYTGSSVAALSRVPSARATGTTRARRHFAATAGTTYRIAIDGARARQGLYRLTLRTTAAPPNDAFADAATLEGAAATAQGQTIGATVEPGEPYGIAGGSAWYRWRAPSNGRVSLKAPVSDFNGRLALFKGDAWGQFTELSSNSLAGVSAFVREGEWYAIAVHGGWQAARGTYALELAHIAAPINDAFAAALPLGDAPASATGTTAAASTEPGEPRHGYYSTLRRSVWWTWTAPADQAVTVHTEGSASGTTLGVYTGEALGALTSVAQNDNASSSGETSRVAFRARAGTTYRIAVDRRPSSGDDVALRLSARDLPVNDTFAAAVDLGDADAVTTISRNDGATPEPGEPVHYGWDGARHSVWFTWTARARGSVTVRADATFATAVAAYTGDTVAGLTRVVNQAQDRVTGGPEQIRIRVEPGTTYRIAVDSIHAQLAGDLALTVGRIDVPANDDFANAVVLEGASADATGTNLGATQEPGEPVHDDNYYDPSVWFTWTAPQDAGVTLDIGASTIPAVVGVYTGDAVNALTRVALVRESSFGTIRRHFRATAGTTYRIAIDGARARQGTYALALRTTPPPGNDAFADAQQLTGSAVELTGNSLGATVEPGEASGPDSSVWYRWTAPSTGRAVVTTPTVDFQGTIRVSTGELLGDQRFVADDGTTWGVTFRAVAGTSYVIAVRGRGTFSLRLAHGPGPANDDLANATSIAGTTGSIDGTTVHATTEPSEWYSDTERSVWYAWTAPADGRLTTRISGVSETPTQAVYTGTSIAALTYVRGGGTTASVGVRRGVTYRIAVGTGSSDMPFTLRWAFVVPPANDAFADATPLVGSAASAGGSTRHASRESWEASHGGVIGTGSTWYRWRAPANGPVTVDTAGSAIDTLLGVYTGSSVDRYEQTHQVSNDDDGAATTSRATFMATAGTTYRIAVDGKTEQGDIRVRLRHAASPVNDAFASAQVISGDAATVTGTLVGATAEDGEPEHAGNRGGASTWYAWTAPRAGELRLSTVGSAANTLLGVYAGDALNALTAVAANDDPAATDRASEVRIPVVAGTTYRIAVDAFADAAGPTQGATALALAFTPEQATDAGGGDPPTAPPTPPPGDGVGDPGDDTGGGDTETGSETGGGDATGGDDTDGGETGGDETPGGDETGGGETGGDETPGGDETGGDPTGGGDTSTGDGDSSTGGDTTTGGGDTTTGDGDTNTGGGDTTTTGGTPPPPAKTQATTTYVPPPDAPLAPTPVERGPTAAPAPAPLGRIVTVPLAPRPAARLAPPAAAPLAVTASLRRQRLADALKRGLIGTATCSRACTLDIVVALGTSGKARSAATGKASAVATGATGTQFVLRLSPAARNALKDARRTLVTVRVTATSNGASATTTRRATLTR